MNDLWQRLATEKSTKYLMVKLPPVLKEFLAEQPTSMSEYVKGLIIADYERQQTATAGSEDGE